MTVKLLTEHRLEFLGLKGGCTGSSESTLVIMLEIKMSGLICDRTDKYQNVPQQATHVSLK